MAYIGTNIVARRGYASPPDGGLSGFLDDLWSGVKGGVSGAVTYYGQAQRDAGAASIATAQANAAAAAARPASLITPTTVAVGGAAVVGLVLLLRKKG